MSFSRTGSFRHGWPICLQSEGGNGSEWGIVRLTIDGSLFNTHPNFKNDEGKRSSLKVNPFDWAYHEHKKNGSSSIKENYDLTVDADNGKEWMMASDDYMYGALPLNPGDYNYELQDRYAQPFSQAEDRLFTRAEHIPNADKYINRVDIILMKIPYEEDYDGYEERQEERNALYKAITGSRFKDITHLYDSVWSLEHGEEIPKEELLGNTSEAQPLYEYVCHLKGHHNSKGELAEWVIKSHETGKILSSHKSEKKAKEHLQQMHIFKESVDSMSYKLLGESTYGTDMDKRVQIFMEGVSQLGLSKNQVDTIGKLTKVCMEGVDGEDTHPYYVSYLFKNERDINKIDYIIDTADPGTVFDVFGYRLNPTHDDNVISDEVPHISENGDDYSFGTIDGYSNVVLLHNDLYMMYRKLTEKEKEEFITTGHVNAIDRIYDDEEPAEF